MSISSWKPESFKLEDADDMMKAFSNLINSNSNEVYVKTKGGRILKFILGVMEFCPGCKMPAREYYPSNSSVVYKSMANEELADYIALCTEGYNVAQLATKNIDYSHLTINPTLVETVAKIDAIERKNEEMKLQSKAYYESKPLPFIETNTNVLNATPNSYLNRYAKGMHTYEAQH